MSVSPWPPPAGPPVGSEHSNEGAFVSASIGVVFGTWIVAYLVAVALGVALLRVAGFAEGETLPPWLVLGSSLALWIPQVVAITVVSRRFGSGNFIRDFGVRFAVRDWWGVPIGVASQLILVNIVTLPLRLLFPDRFSVEEVERRARELVDGTNGWWWLAIVFVVVVGAPLVEELMYRGFIQGSLARRIPALASVLLTAAWFTVVHLQPVEFPGLFAFAVVLGWCRWKTGRIGMSIVAHVAFNVTGLLMVALAV